MNALLHVLKTHRSEATRSAPTNDVAVGEKLADKYPATDEGDIQEKCPVIRANQVFLSATNAGRMRVVFF